MKYGAKWPEYAKQWDAMQLNSSRMGEFEQAARYAIKHKDIYQRIELATRKKLPDGTFVPLTGVPWPMVACNHWRESSGDFDTYLGNGQPLARRTTIVPIGRGPFTGPDAFVDGAVDAYQLQNFDDVIDWRLEKQLFKQEQFNGEGYDNKGLPSPYIWGGTNIQKPGKYVADHVFDPNVMDGQLGCAGIMHMIFKLDPTVEFVRETPAGVVEPPVSLEPPRVDPPVAKPPVVQPPVVQPLVSADLQGLINRRAEIATDIAMLKAEDAELVTAINVIQRYARKP